MIASYLLKTCYTITWRLMPIFWRRLFQIWTLFILVKPIPAQNLEDCWNETNGTNGA
jgi:hypothetical protein